MEAVSASVDGVLTQVQTGLAAHEAAIKAAMVSLGN